METMADSSTFQKQRLGLVPLRRGKRLLRTTTTRDSRHGILPLWHSTTPTPTDPSGSSSCPSSEVPLIIGRPDLLPCFYAACGHGIKDKCDECKAVNEWSIALSRQMLRFWEAPSMNGNTLDTNDTSDDKATPTTTTTPTLWLQVRGTHAQVSVMYPSPFPNAIAVDADAAVPHVEYRIIPPIEFMDHPERPTLEQLQQQPENTTTTSPTVPVTRGTRLCLAPIDGGGGMSLEWEVVLVDPSAMTITSPMLSSPSTTISGKSTTRNQSAPNFVLPPPPPVGKAQNKNAPPLPPRSLRRGDGNAMTIDPNLLSTAHPNRISFGNSSFDNDDGNDDDDDEWDGPLSQPWSQPLPPIFDSHNNHDDANHDNKNERKGLLSQTNRSQPFTALGSSKPAPPRASSLAIATASTGSVVPVQSTPLSAHPKDESSSRRVSKQLTKSGDSANAPPPKLSPPPYPALMGKRISVSTVAATALDSTTGSDNEVVESPKSVQPQSSLKRIVSISTDAAATLERATTGENDEVVESSLPTQPKGCVVSGRRVSTESGAAAVNAAVILDQNQDKGPQYSSKKVIASKTAPTESACTVGAIEQKSGGQTQSATLSAAQVVSTSIGGACSTMAVGRSKELHSTRHTAKRVVSKPTLNSKHRRPQRSSTSAASTVPTSSSKMTRAITVDPNQPIPQCALRRVSFATASASKSRIKALGRRKTLLTSLSKRDVSAASVSQNDTVTKPKFILFFVPGQDLSRHVREKLTKRAQKLGASVILEFRMATHLIVSENVPGLKQVAESLNVPLKKLKDHLDQNHVRLIVSEWISEAGATLESPSIGLSWFGYNPMKRASEDVIHSRSKKKPHRHEIEQPPVPSGPRNEKLSELFRKLSKLHQSCPLLDDDTWKAYCFSVNAGRLRNLSFEVVDDPKVLARLKNIGGFGPSSMEKVKEYLQLGTIKRIKAFETDPRLIAMKNMMNIWGVGQHTARGLVESGYRDIAEVRADIVHRKLNLDRNQLVGVECYEDILEEMGRDEVEAIGRIVEQAIKYIYPDADVEVMGSYRRGKTGCGDVDVLITHKNFKTKVPQKQNENPLGEIVDKLWRQGHIAFHLTYLPGMETGQKPRDYQASSRFVPAVAWEASRYKSYKRRGTNNSNPTSATYFGVFRSPVVVGRRRRVDLKFYPYRERAFASLYFTGNGFFNRSMRLWASRMSYSLNDSGLFKRETAKRVMEATSEKEVFDKLGLQYKAPNERDCFDAVVPLRNAPLPLELQTKRSEKSDYNEDQLHDWID